MYVTQSLISANSEQKILLDGIVGSKTRKCTALALGGFSAPLELDEKIYGL